MFIITQKPTFAWPVKFEIPGDARAIRCEFVAEFNRIPQNRIDELTTGADPVSDEALLDEVMVGWRDVKDEQGNDVEFNAANRRQLLAIPGTRRAIVLAFLEAITGVAKLKN